MADEENGRFTLALDATTNLLVQELNPLGSSGSWIAASANFEIQSAAVNQRSAAFYRHFLPWQKDLLSVLSRSYRRYFKIALANPVKAGPDAHQWAWDQLQPALNAVLEWVRNWYIAACEAQQPIASTEVIPGQTITLSVPIVSSQLTPWRSWCAPAWLFAISPYVGVGPLKTKHVPANDTDQKLGASHTRLILKGAKRVFLWQLGTAIETARNEELAAAGTIPGQPAIPAKRKPKSRRIHDKQGIIRDRMIAEIATISPTPIEFLQNMDERKIKPQPTWSGWPGSWKEAYKNPRLRALIHKDKSRALARAARRK